MLSWKAFCVLNIHYYYQITHDMNPTIAITTTAKYCYCYKKKNCPEMPCVLHTVTITNFIPHDMM